MPSLGADMTEGTLLEWLVQPGDAVHRGDIVAVVDTSKSAIDVEVFQDGRITELLVEPGTTVPVGTPLATLEAAEPATPEPTPPAPTPPAPAAPAPAAKHRAPKAAKATPAPATTAPVAHVAASPLARRRAAELGIDLADLASLGHVLSVTDVEAAAAHRAGTVPLAPPEVPVEPGPAEPPTPEPTTPAAATPGHAAAMREAIAALMARSKKEIPHYYLQTTIDLAAALDWLERTNASRSVADRILPAALLLKAVAVAVHDVPEMNGFFVEGAFVQQPAVHLGVAVSLRGGGLIAPALHDADALGLDDLMAGMKDLVTRARSGRLRSSEMSDPTLTVTNLGEQGAEAVHGVIYPPQVALVGFGRIVERPWAVDGMLTVRPSVIATLAADHRVSDGHRGGLFLAAIDAALQAPERL